MNIEILSPLITNPSVCMRYTQESSEPYTREWHIHDEYEMFYVAKGEKAYFIGDAQYPISEGDVIFVNGGVPHKTFSRENAYGYLIQFMDDFPFNKENRCLLKFAKTGFKDAFVFKSGSDVNREIVASIENIICESEKKDKAYDIFVRSYVYNIYAILCRNGIINYYGSIFNVRDVKRIDAALTYINDMYAKSITLDEISEFMHVDKAHFCRIFKKGTNTSFLQYLNFVRICNAEKMLTETDKSVADIAYETGFNNCAYFIKVFKKFKNCTPAVYRKIKAPHSLTNA